MKTMRVRTISARDVERIRSLVKQLSPKAELPDAARIRKMLKGHDVELWVVKDDERIVGMGTLATAPLLRWSYATIEDVVVDEAYRGKGLGKAIMRKLLERAHAKGARHVDLTSRPDRVEANKLYQKLGSELRNKKTNFHRFHL